MYLILNLELLETDMENLDFSGSFGFVIFVILM